MAWQTRGGSRVVTPSPGPKNLIYEGIAIWEQYLGYLSFDATKIVFYLQGINYKYINTIRVSYRGVSLLYITI